MARRLADAISVGAARIASILGPQRMRIIARVNKYVTNPVQRLWAARVRYMAVIEHRGRRSGRLYRTPVMAFVQDDAIWVVLNYGVKSDWVRNVTAAGGAVVAHSGKRFSVSDPLIFGIDSAELPPQIRSVGDPTRSALRATMTPQ